MLTSFIENETHCSHRSNVTREMAWLRSQDVHGNDPEHWCCCQCEAFGPKAGVCTHGPLFDSTSHAGPFLPDVRDLLSTPWFELRTFGLGNDSHCRWRGATAGYQSIVTTFPLILWLSSSSCVGPCVVELLEGRQRRR